MKTTFLLPAIFCCFNLLAQSSDVSKKNQNETSIQSLVNTNDLLLSDSHSFQNFSNTGGILYDLRYEGIKGSPYLFNKWQDGILLLKDGKLKTAPIKYNSYDKSVEIKQLGDSISLYPYQIKGFKIHDPIKNSEMLFLKIENLKINSGVIPVTFLFVIYNNKVGFFKHFSKDMLKADYKDPYSANRTYDSFQDNSEYFFKKADETIVKIKLNKKSIVDAMSDKEEAIKKFVRDKKIANENDILEVIKYYESL